MKSIILFIKNNPYPCSVAFVLFFAMILRFYNYGNRWGIAFDQAHDALIARHAVSAFQLPLLGPFSSAGPFQTGGEWYWLLMIPTALFPQSVLSPWIFMTGLYVVFIGVMMFIGNKLEGKSFSLFVGAFSALSTAQLAQSVSLTNQSPQSFLSAIAIAYMIIFLQTKKNTFLFLCSLCISLAISIHLQGVALIMLLIVLLIFSGSFSIKNIIAIMVGLLIPMVPILLYDFGHDFFNTKNMLHYYLYDQYNISLDVLGRRWLTYAGVFIPGIWSYIIGGHLLLGYIQIFLAVFISSFLFLRNKLKREWFVILISTILMISLLKYTRTPLFESYFVFIHPFILLITSLVVYRLSSINRYIGILLFCVIAISTFIKDIPLLKGGYNYSAETAHSFIRTLSNKYPDKKFAIYDKNFAARDKSAPLALFLDVENKIDDKGRKIGITIHTGSIELPYPVILGERGAYQLFDLQASTSAQLSKDNWVLMNPSEMYRSTEAWYTKK